MMDKCAGTKCTCIMCAFQSNHVICGLICMIEIFKFVKDKVKVC